VPGAERGTPLRLEELSIRDFAIINELRIQWTPGLNVLTGETGAGKSIIVDALGAVLGDRMDPNWLRAGAERAFVEAVFCGARLPETVSDVLASSGAEPDDDQLILSRDVAASRSASRVNARTVPLNITQQIAERLVDLHSQASHLSLTRPREHLAILDRYAGLERLRSEMASRARGLLQVRREILESEQANRQTSREAELLRHEVDEIDAAEVSPREEEELEAQRLRLKNALHLRQLAEAAHASLHGRENRRGALDLVGQASQSVDEIIALDPASDLRSERLTEAMDAAEDLARALRRYADELEEDPSALEAIEERLLSLAELKRKYGATLQEVLEYRDRAAERLDGIEHHEEYIAGLREREMELREQAAQAAEALSRERGAAIGRLEQDVGRELGELGMGGARIEVALTSRADSDGLQFIGESAPRAFDESGADAVEFLIAANPGEPPRPLARVASGGELARFMLALKSVLSEADETPVLIFDELDQGVGGRMGHVIGEKLWQIARHHQVLCITHLPQVAAYADSHYLVSKATAGDRTTTEVTRLADPERVEEIALMLGGAHAGPVARQGAEELLSGAARWKAGASA
jgi:DNA repair protein RecN (Recombination protein N)